MKLLEEDFVLLVQPKLAQAVGLNEALFLQQVHYWVTKSGILMDGEKWIYNAYTSWQKQFPFWSERTIRRIVKRLDELGVLVSANYNRANFDKTKWYRIDYGQLQALLGEASFFEQSGQSGITEEPPCPPNNRPLCPAPSSNMATPIQKTKTKTMNHTNDIELIFRNAGIHLTKKQREQLQQWQAHFSLDDMQKAINEATKRSALSWPYVNGILQAWHKKGGQRTRDERIPQWFATRNERMDEDVLDENLVNRVRSKIEALQQA